MKKEVKIPEKGMTLLVIPFVLSAIGSFLIIPTQDSALLGAFFWFMILFVFDLFFLQKIFGGIRKTPLSIALFLSILFVLLGLLTSVRSSPHFFLFFFLLSLFNIHATSDFLEKNTLVRSTKFLLFFLLKRFFLLSQIPSPFQKTGDMTKKMSKFFNTGILFVFLGILLFPLIIELLSKSNPLFGGWMRNIFDFSFLQIPDDIIPYLFFIAFFGTFLISEKLMIEKIREKSEETKEEKEFPPSFGESFLKALVGILSLLNLLYVIFIAAEIQYDLGALRDLVDIKELDSFSALAVGRFWELIAVAGINIILILGIQKTFESEKKSLLFSRIFSGNIIFLFLMTFFLIFSSGRRLEFYEDAYGFTFLRLFAHSFLPILAIIFGLLVSSFFWKKYKNILFQSGLGLFFVFFTAFATLPIDFWVSSINIAHRHEIFRFDPLYSAKNPDGMLPLIKLLQEENSESREKILHSITSITGEISPKEGDSNIQEKILNFVQKERAKNWRERNIMSFLIVREAEKIDF